MNLSELSTESILLYLILADYITGVGVGFLEKKVNSSIGIKGIFQKIGILIGVFVCALIDSLNLSDTQIQPLVIMFFIANETISVFENLGKLNVPIPKVLTTRLKVLKEKTEKE